MVEHQESMRLLLERQNENHSIVENLLACEKLAFDNMLHANLPESPGLYVISRAKAAEGEYLRAGRTNGVGGLRQRIYRNHFMGSQQGNLKAQLVTDGICSDFEQAKLWVKNYCLVQYFIVHDVDIRRWAEYHMLSVLRPKYCD